MAGLVKAKKYEWQDSNLALFGSKLERNVKKAAAKTEPAWQKAGQEIGLQIWRIVNFNVEPWPKEQYGQFFNGDSYIVLNTYKKRHNDELLYDVHFWIGKYSTPDEYGTAAYKTVELDTLLDDKPIQHREVMGHESELFKSYFPEIVQLEGGADSGFYHVNNDEYKPRLLHFHGLKVSQKDCCHDLIVDYKQKIELYERPLSKKSLDNTDVFILDLGEKIYQWNGDKANKDERFKAALYLSKLKGERGKCDSFTYDGEDSEWDKLVQKYLPDEELVDDNDGGNDTDDFKPSLFKLSDETGEMVFTEISQGNFSRTNLDPNDVFIADTGKECFVWVGKGASPRECRQAMSYAHDYLRRTGHPFVPVCRVVDGKEEPLLFQALFFS